MPSQFDVVIELDKEGYYVASVPQIPGCHAQPRSLEEVTQRIREAIEVCPDSQSMDTLPESTRTLTMGPPPRTLPST